MEDEKIAGDRSALLIFFFLPFWKWVDISNRALEQITVITLFLMVVRKRGKKWRWNLRSRQMISRNNYPSLCDFFDRKKQISIIKYFSFSLNFCPLHFLPLLTFSSSFPFPSLSLSVAQSRILLTFSSFSRHPYHRASPLSTPI